MTDTLSPYIHSAAEHIFLFGFIFILTLMIAIIVHELGHYIVARLCGVHVQQFSFGFGREIFSIGSEKDNKTKWSICIFPVGGYVKIFGDVDPLNPLIWDKENECARSLTKKELDVSFCMKPLWQRSLIVLAGPIANFILFLLILIMMFTFYGERSQFPIITSLATSAPAYEAGVKINDKIVAMDGKPIRRLSDIYDHTIYEVPPKTHNYTIERNKETLYISFKARILKYTNKKGIEREHGQTGMVQIQGLKLKNIKSINGTDTNEDKDLVRKLIILNFDKPIYLKTQFRRSQEDEFLIIVPEQYNQHLKYPNHKYYDLLFTGDSEGKFYIKNHPIVSTQRALFTLIQSATMSYKLVMASVDGRNDDKIVGGVGRISEKAGNSFKQGFYNYMMFLAGFSFMIGILNLLPIPGLDGGYLLFHLYEAIVGKPLSYKIQDLCLIVGLIVLGGIMIFANVSDLLSFI